MVKRFDWLLVYLLFSIGVMAQSGGKQYNSYKGLVMAGYQGCDGRSQLFRRETG